MAGIIIIIQTFNLVQMKTLGSVGFKSLGSRVIHRL